MERKKGKICRFSLEFLGRGVRSFQSWEKDYTATWKETPHQTESTKHMTSTSFLVVGLHTQARTLALSCLN